MAHFSERSQEEASNVKYTNKSKACKYIHEKLKCESDFLSLEYTYMAQ